MKIDKPGWSVVATVDEPPQVVLVFVAWYLALGAAEVTLYFDRPDDPAADMLGSYPGVTVVRCDAAHWARLGRARPDKHQIRQLRNATDAYNKLQSEWLLHVDADEFLWPSLPVEQALERIYPWTQSVIVPVAERVFGPQHGGASIYEGFFRRPFTGRAAEGRRIFGPDYDLTLRGMTGHAVGKSFTCQGHNMVVSIHRPKLDGPGVLETEPAQGLSLLHFEGLTPLHWVVKLLRKADAFEYANGMQPTVHRQRQIDAIASDPKDAMALHDRLKRINAQQRTIFDEHNLLQDVVFHPPEHFAGTKVDMTPHTFDRWLWERHSRILKTAGFRRP